MRNISGRQSFTHPLEELVQEQKGQKRFHIEAFIPIAVNTP